MSSVVTAVRHRVDPAPLTALVAVGDLACIAVFVVVGASQGHGIDPLAEGTRIAKTVTSFAVGWAIAATVAGLYSAEVRQSAKRSALRTVPAWVAAAVVAQGLRATPPFPGNAAVAFFLVSVAVGLVLLVPWRVAVTRLARES